MVSLVVGPLGDGCLFLACLVDVCCLLIGVCCLLLDTCWLLCVMC